MSARASIAVCICTRDRPESLRLCLDAIADGTMLPNEVLVSDDSLHPEKSFDICAQFHFVRYLAGPKQGLCANRNRVIAESSSTHVALIDDDGVVARDFVERVLSHAQTEPSTTIITGSVLEFGSQLFVPGAPDVWGNFTQKPRDGHYETIQLNCNLFPRSCFDLSSFDELIRYGFEDMDLCSQLLSLGYTIRWDPQLINAHYPPIQTSELTSERFRQWEQARYYTSLKRYILWKKRPLCGVLYLMAAPLYTIVFSIKWMKWSRIPNIVPDMWMAAKLFLRYKQLHRLKDVRAASQCG